MNLRQLVDSMCDGESIAFTKDGDYVTVHYCFPDRSNAIEQSVSVKAIESSGMIECMLKWDMD